MFKDKHRTQIIEVNEEEVELKVYSLNDSLLSEFFLKKLPTDSAEEIALKAYQQVYGE